MIRTRERKHMQRRRSAAADDEVSADASRVTKLENLQRTAGNSAVTTLLQRAGALALQITSEALQMGLAQALQEHGEPVTPAHITVLDRRPERLLAYNLRISRAGTVLPSWKQIDVRKAAPGSVQGAQFLLQGALQQAGDTVRRTMRVVSVETSEILGSGMGDATGTGASAVHAAASLALAKLGPLTRVVEPAPAGGG